jgi:multicomponent Na+:H+ antiporter subunit G
VSVVLDVFSIVAIVAGLVFFLAGTVGLLRFPDAYTRLHALTKADNLGVALVVTGLLPQMDGVLAALKLVLVCSGAVSQLIARSVRRRECSE